MAVDLVSPGRLFVAATFNDWSPDQPAHELQHVEDGVWEGRIVLERGGQAFKFAVDGNWDVNWGDDGSKLVIPPMEGHLQPDGANILMNILLPGLYLFRVSLTARTWNVFPRQVGNGPVASLQVRNNLSWLGDFLSAVEAHGPQSAENWYRTRLRPGEFNGQVPLAHGDEVVFLLWNQSPSPVSVCGTFNDWSTTTHVMTRVADTPLQYLQVKLPRSIPYEYKFYQDGRWFRDPHNALVAWDGVDRFGAPGEFNSVLPAVPSRPVAHLLWIKQFYSLFLNNERDIYVQLPPGYEHDRERYPVLYVNDGNESITRAQLDTMARIDMDTGRAERLILVFVGGPPKESRAYEYIEHDGRVRYARFLTQELVPFIDAHFGTRADPQWRGILGGAWGGFNAFYVAYFHSDVFGKAGAQGGSFHVNDYEMVRTLRDGEVRPVKFYLDSSKPMADFGRGDNHAQSVSMAQALQDRGYRYLHHETEGERHDWASWKNRFHRALTFFWPGRSA